MNHHERMLRTIRGQPTDQIPWAPRMDLWWVALRSRGTLPDRFSGLDTAGIADELDVACHCTRADCTLPTPKEDQLLRGLGISNHPDHPFRIEVRDLEVECEHDERHLKTTIYTAAGPVTMHLESSPEMAKDGITAPFVHAYAIKSPDDFEAVAQLFEHLEVIPTSEGYSTFHQRMGDRGLAVAGGPTGASPMHLVLHDLAAMDQFFYLYADDKSGLLELCRRMEPFFDSMIQVLASSEAEAVMWGGNYDRDLTWPPFFSEQIAPWLQKVGQRLHGAGKYLITHTDGENDGLMPLYGKCGCDVVESVCPHPMTKFSLAEIRAGMGPEVTVWGGIPSVSLLPDTMDDMTFESYIDDLFADLGTGERLILGVSDNVPPDADMSRLERIKERVQAFGPVEPKGVLQAN